MWEGLCEGRMGYRQPHVSPRSESECSENCLGAEDELHGVDGSRTTGELLHQPEIGSFFKAVALAIQERNAIGVSVASKDRPIQKLGSERVLQAQTGKGGQAISLSEGSVLVWVMHWVLFSVLSQPPGVSHSD